MHKPGPRIEYINENSIVVKVDDGQYIRKAQQERSTPIMDFKNLGKKADTKPKPTNLSNVFSLMPQRPSTVKKAQTLRPRITNFAPSMSSDDELNKCE